MPVREMWTVHTESFIKTVEPGHPFVLSKGKPAKTIAEVRAEGNNCYLIRYTYLPLFSRLFDFCVNLVRRWVDPIENPPQLRFSRKRLLADGEFVQLDKWAFTVFIQPMGFSLGEDR